MMAFHHLLTDRIVVSPRIGTGSDVFGEAIYGPKTEIKCALKRSSQKVRDSSGTERVSAHVVITAIKLGEDDRVWLPDEQTGIVDPSNDSSSKTPISFVTDKSRRSGTAIFQAFF